MPIKLIRSGRGRAQASCLLVIAIASEEKLPNLEEVIRHAKKNPGGTLAEIFQCGRTQIAQIFESKDSV